MGTFAQWAPDTDQSLKETSVSKYRVNAQLGHTYTWSVVDPITGNPVDGAKYTLSSTQVADKNVATIIWNASGEYKVSVNDRVDATTCDSDNTSSFKVTVTDNKSLIVWDDTHWDNINNKCPEVNYTIQLSLSNANYKATVTYSFIDEGSYDHGKISGNGADIVAESDDSGVFCITVNGFTVNPGDNNYEPEFIIKTISDKYGVVPTNLVAMKTHKLIIHKNPNTSAIEHD